MAEYRTIGNGQQSPSLGIQMGWVYMVIPVTGVITAVYNVMNIAELTQQIKTSENRKRRINIFAALYDFVQFWRYFFSRCAHFYRSKRFSAIAILPTVDFDVTMITADSEFLRYVEFHFDSHSILYFGW